MFGVYSLLEYGYRFVRAPIPVFVGTELECHRYIDEQGWLWGILLTVEPLPDYDE